MFLTNRSVFVGLIKSYFEGNANGFNLKKYFLTTPFDVLSFGIAMDVIFNRGRNCVSALSALMPNGIPYGQRLRKNDRDSFPFTFNLAIKDLTRFMSQQEIHDRSRKAVYSLVKRGGIPYEFACDMFGIVDQDNQDLEQIIQNGQRLLFLQSGHLEIVNSSDGLYTVRCNRCGTSYTIDSENNDEIGHFVNADICKECNKEFKGTFDSKIESGVDKIGSCLKRIEKDARVHASVKYYSTTIDKNNRQWKRLRCEEYEWEHVRTRFRIADCDQMFDYAGLPYSSDAEIHRIGHEYYGNKVPYGPLTAMWLPQDINRSIQKTNNVVVTPNGVQTSFRSACLEYFPDDSEKTYSRLRKQLQRSELSPQEIFDQECAKRYMSQ